LDLDIPVSSLYYFEIGNVGLQLGSIDRRKRNRGGIR
jgi:hypothetical protein